MDSIDEAILEELERKSNWRFHQLADLLNIPRSTLHNRIKKLERIGVIRTYKAVVDHRKLGRPVTAFVNIVIASEQSAEEIANHITQLSCVEEVHIVTGQFDLIAKARFGDTEELGRFLFDKTVGLRSLDGIVRTESMVVLHTRKEMGLKSVN